MGHGGPFIPSHGSSFMIKAKKNPKKSAWFCLLKILSRYKYTSMPSGETMILINMYTISTFKKKIQVRSNRQM